MRNLSAKTVLKSIKLALLALVLGTCVTAQAASAGMVDIPQGRYLRGDSDDNNAAGNARTNWVYVSAFQMDSNLVTFALWQKVYQWAINNGYSFTNAGARFTDENNPVHTVNWHDAVKWCNARSQMESNSALVPCYYTDTNLQTIYKIGVVTLKNENVNWAANGYRLPTEAEWEKAARGGLNTNRFPRFDTISHSQATYKSPLVPLIYDAGPPSVAPVATTRVGQYPANGFGLYDMAGNVQEWCWDWYAATYYTNSSSWTNPVGPVIGVQRVFRGGAWNDYADAARCAERGYNSPLVANNWTGFRTVQIVQTPTNITSLTAEIYPPNQTIMAGAPATFNATNVSGGTAPYHYQYQWRFKTTDIPGETSQSYTIPHVVKNDGGTYTVVVTDNHNSPSVTSAPATLTVTLPGDTNGDDIVNQAELNAVLAYCYWTNFPPIITNTAGLGAANVTFDINNFTAGVFRVEFTTNLANPNWHDLGQVRPLYQFSDPGAALGQQRFYRLVASTNSF